MPDAVSESLSRKISMKIKSKTPDFHDLRKSAARVKVDTCKAREQAEQ